MGGLGEHDLAGDLLPIGEDCGDSRPCLGESNGWRELMLERKLADYLVVTRE